MNPPAVATAPPDTRGDLDLIQRGLDLLLAPGDLHELRCPKTAHGVVSGYFNDFTALARAAFKLSGRAESVYITLNPCLPDLRARANNRCNEYVGSGLTTADKFITRRRWFFVDFDAVRPAGISATDAEHQAAIDRAIRCRDWLLEEGWPAPILADSGNGAHLLYRINLPNDAHSEHILKQCLLGLANRFNDEVVTVDRTTFNASRICKVYGTLAAKGDSVPDLGRVYRMARLLDVPDVVQVVGLDGGSE